MSDNAAALDPFAAFPGSLSPSRANDFLTCPLLFRFRTIDRLPEPSSPAALRGTLVHTALEHLFDLPAADWTLRFDGVVLEPFHILDDRGIPAGATLVVRRA